MRSSRLAVVEVDERPRKSSIGGDEDVDNNYLPHPLTPLCASENHSTYSWHLALLWVSAMHTLTSSNITVNKVSATV